MHFLLQVRFGSAQAALAELEPAERQGVFDEYRALAQQPGVLTGSQLTAPDTAVTVRVGDGGTVTAEGQAAAGALDGYYLYEGEDLEAALALAARIPAARMGGSVEVRALVER